MSDDEFGSSLPKLKDELGVLQRSLRDAGIPVIVVLEGWNAAGITMSVNEVIQALDPRGFSLHSIDRPTEGERARPFLWRFWVRTPNRGRIALFARSWYSRALVEEFDNFSWKKNFRQLVDSINNFERQLNDDGALVIKFFLHIDKDEQKRRLLERERNPLTAWLVTPRIWEFHYHYETHFSLIDEFIEKTNNDEAPWQIVEATDRNYTIHKIYSTLIKKIEKRLDESGAGIDESKKLKKIKKAEKQDLSPVKRRTSASKSYSKDECETLFRSLQADMTERNHLLLKRKIPFIIVYEGWDASGKGGNIIRLARYMNPLGYDVIPVMAPNSFEKDHHYLRRFIQYFPKAGHVAIFDRSWYGRVLVERVDGLCSEYDWQRAYREINEMEQDYVESSGGGIVKFWLDIDKDVQLKRFQQREEDPLKQYKITEDDWHNREKWDLYDVAVNDMLARTNTSYAPWTVIESDEKWYARVKAIKSVISGIDSLL
jgi:polyphosphate:AMP phosphotransferase